MSPWLRHCKTVDYEVTFGSLKDSGVISANHWGSNISYYYLSESLLL